MLTNLSRHPLKTMIIPGSEHDLPALKALDPRCFPKGSILYGDAAYVEYEYEDKMLKEEIKVIVDCMDDIFSLRSSSNNFWMLPKELIFKIRSFRLNLAGKYRHAS